MLSVNPQIYNFDVGKERKKFFPHIKTFLLFPMKQKKKICTEFQKEILKEDFSGRLGADLSSGTVFTKIEKPKPRVRKNFPEVWIYDIFETNSGSEELRKTLPDSITTWMLDGISINAEKGLAIAETQKVRSFKDFFLKVEKPYSSKVGEIVTIKVIVYNFMNKTASASVNMIKSGDQFDFFESNQVTADNNKILQETINQGQNGLFTFKIKPKKVGKILLKFMATTNGVRDQVHETLLVKSLGIRRRITRSKIMTGISKVSFDFDIPTNIAEDLITFEVQTSTDVLGPAIDNFEKLM